MTYKRLRKYSKIEPILLLIFAFEFSFPHYAAAANTPANQAGTPAIATQADVATQAVPTVSPVAPTSTTPVVSDSTKIELTKIIKETKVLRIYNLTVTAYSSTVDQTDSDPCTTANGFNLCQHNQEDVVAANFLPFGAKIRIPEYFGDRIFTVQDRMNSRYTYHVDVWMKTRQAAIDLGAPYTKIEVIAY